MKALILSIVIPFLGPVVDGLTVLRWRPRLWAKSKEAATNNGISLKHWSRLGGHYLMIVLVAVAFLSLVIPSNYRDIGLWSVVLTLGTLALAEVVSRQWGAKSAAKEAAALGQEMVLGATAAGFLVHALADGAALFSFAGTNGVAMGPAIIVDRFATGVLVWGMIAGRYGAVRALLALALVGVATALGYGLMEYVSLAVGNRAFIGVIQSALAGFILFMVFNHAQMCPPATP